VDRDRLNIGLYEARLVELEQELAGDEITTEQFEAARGELQRDLLNTTTVNAETKTGVTTSGRWAALVVGVAVPLLAMGLYWQIGSPQLSQHDAAAQQMPGDMGNLVEKLKQRLEANPDDIEGWRLLSRTLVIMERFNEAAPAMGRAVELAGSKADPDLLAQYAEVLTFSQGGSLAGKPIELTQRALELNPDHQHALWLSGMNAYNLGDMPIALKQWRHLLTLLSPEDEMVATLRAAITEAEAASGMASPAKNSAAIASAVIKLNVVLDDRLADKVEPNDTLFVFARPTSGPKMPIAGLRRTAGDLPLTITLSDAHVMVAGQSLTDHKQLDIVARISKSGKTAPHSGDMEGKANITVGHKNTVTVRITDVVP
jgi:cytochrome c-type biogenesis protein CcmH